MWRSCIFKRGYWYLSLFWVNKNDLDTQNKKKDTLVIFTRHSYLGRQGWYFCLNILPILITETSENAAKDEEINPIRLTSCVCLGSLLGQIKFHYSDSNNINWVLEISSFLPIPHQNEGLSVDPNSFLFLLMWTFHVNLSWCMFLVHKPRVIWQVF